MTCDEFRRLNNTDDAPFRITRAERSAGLNHVYNCEKCHDWLISLPPICIPIEEAIRREMHIQVLEHEDHLDPEFHNPYEKDTYVTILRPL